MVINRISCPHFHDLWVLSDHLFIIFHSLQSVICSTDLDLCFGWQDQMLF
jgi:hypothetical protein